MPYIEFTTFIEKRLLNVFLDYEGTKITVTTLLFTLKTKEDIVQRVAYADSIPSITEFSRL